jgi:hypothetical protein
LVHFFPSELVISDQSLWTELMVEYLPESCVKYAFDLSVSDPAPITIQSPSDHKITLTETSASCEILEVAAF